MLNTSPSVNINLLNQTIDHKSNDIVFPKIKWVKNEVSDDITINSIEFREPSIVNKTIFRENLELF
jgi:hypothetical protein